MSININLRPRSLQPQRPKCPNEVPTTTASYKLAVIGEAPTKIDVEAQRPFMGPPGHVLSEALIGCGILRSACYVGNLTPYQPPNNKFYNFKWNCPELKEGMDQLTKDLQTWKPNLVLLLGNNALKNAGVEEKLSDFRGSLFKCSSATSPFFALKCLATYHPTFINQNGFDQKPIFHADVRRAYEEAESNLLKLPDYDFILHPTTDCILNRLELCRRNGNPIAIDIEGSHPSITCISVCETPTSGFIIPFKEFTPQTMLVVVRELAKVLQDPSIPKILQNGLYDASNLAQSFNILINPIADDTMLMGWELQPELRKSLALQTSIYTRQPYYKGDRKKDDRDVHFNYCCTDSAVTYEIRNRHAVALEQDQPANEHYKFSLACLRPLLYCQLRGINYDVAKAGELKKKFILQRDEVGRRINSRGQQYYGPDYNLNVNSHKKLQELLYTKIGLPKQYQTKRNPDGSIKKTVTANEEACLDLFTRFNDSVVTDVLAWRNFDKRRQYVELLFDKDNRMRSSYNLVGTVTGRVSSSKTISGTGYNLQTIPKELRCLFRADPGHHFFQCDLAGADGWTVAAYSASLGDPTMLEDYMEGIKPAKVIALMYHHGAEVNQWSREQIKEAAKSIKEEGEGWWLYFASKRVQHATSYDAKAPKIAETILKDAYKKEGQLIHVSKDKCAQLQDLYERVRYRGVLNFKNFIKNKLNTTQGRPTLTDASGHTRTFFGRPHDPSTYREALSHLPQSNTTYATNMALLNLWQDPENRRSDGSLRIEPLHQVHDAVCGQFRIEDAAWAIDRLHNYFNNPIKIADLEITIPFDGAYGPSWGELGTTYGGGLI